MGWGVLLGQTTRMWCQGLNDSVLSPCCGFPILGLKNIATRTGKKSVMLRDSEDMAVRPVLGTAKDLPISDKPRSGLKH